MVQLFYTTYINVHLAHHELLRAKIGKGGIKNLSSMISKCQNQRLQTKPRHPEEEP